MKPRRSIEDRAIITRCVVLLAWLCLVPTALAEQLQNHSPAGLLDGTPRVLVVNGYSTSAHWPRILQQEVDVLLGPDIVEVRSAIKGGTPIARWIDVETGERLWTWNEVLRPKLHDKHDRPVVVLAQQSLQWVFGRRFEGIRHADDQERINQGAKALKLYAETLLEDGADEVLIATHIYKHRMEPEIGNESFALDALLKRKPPRIHRGPDVWTPTKRDYPRAFARDGVHPNRLGAELMAQLWFETLLSHEPHSSKFATSTRR